MCTPERSATALAERPADGADAAAGIEGASPSPARLAAFGSCPLQEAWLAPRNAAIAVMLLYRRTISPLYGQVCRYYPSCSRYAVDAFQRQGFLAGIGLTAWRLLRCNPFTPGGIDDAPVRRRFRYAVNSRGFVRPVDRKA